MYEYKYGYGDGDGDGRKKWTQRAEDAWKDREII
jgi:hypothetical protein